jgi:hypothetical protein
MKTLFVFSALVICAAALAQNAPGGPVSMVVTAEGRHKESPPDIPREDVTVFQDKTRVQVTDWLPLRGDHAALELFILIDDSSNTNLGSQIPDIRAFIEAQPATTAIGLGYMRDGTVLIAQNLTNNHAQVAKSVRLPLGNGAAYGSPYLSLEDLLKRWPQTPVRREVLMISNGLDPLYDGGPSDPYVDASIEKAQRAGVVVFTLFASGAGHMGHSLWRVNWGQSYLSKLADLTGGEAFFQGFETPVSLKPFLEELSDRLGRQYLLAFLPRPPNKSGVQRIHLKTELPNVELVAAQEVYVQGVKK